MKHTKKNRRMFSVERLLLKKSREAALSAIQIFNNPNTQFKTESFIVLMHIAWTSLLHAYYKKEDVEYRYYRQHEKRRTFYKTKGGTHKHWELKKCLDTKGCPLPEAVKANLNLLIGLRNEIEHQMIPGLDEYSVSHLQSCCLNYNEAMENLFGQGIKAHQPISLQFFAFGEEQISSLKEKPNLPKNLVNFIEEYESGLHEEDIQSQRYAYRVHYRRDNTNHPSQADKVIFTKDEGRKADRVLIKEQYRQYTKLTQKQIVEQMRGKGYVRFSPQDHLNFWKEKWPNADARNKEAKEFGEIVGAGWFWYEETWLPMVQEHCSKNPHKFMEDNRKSA